MSIDGSRVAIIGGSIAGCTAAIALTRAGCEVTVYERTRGVLQDRGFGIGIPASLHDELVSAQYLDAGTPAYRYSDVSWFVADPGTEQGRLLATLPTPGLACENWSILWRSLRSQIPDATYQDGVTVTQVHADSDNPVLTFADGGTASFDLIVGADGYRSVVRQALAPAITPQAAGYGLWRASCPDFTLPSTAREMIERSGFMVLFPHGHGGGYLIPDAARLGGWMLNWFVYIVPPTPFDDFRMRLPGTVDRSLHEVYHNVLVEYFPPLWADTLNCTDLSNVSVQPIYDLTIPSYVSGRCVVLGDAGAVARPHTASGATTALLDALALARWCQTCTDWGEILDGYNQERCPAGNQQAELGRRLGQAEVTNTPDWKAMSSADFLNWRQELVADRHSFLDG